MTTRLTPVAFALGIATSKLSSAFRGEDAPDYDVAEVHVKGPIQRDPPRTIGRRNRSTADDVVEQIETADEDDAVEALVVRLNTPGGEIVPSEDIRLAVEAFDGPTVGYMTDVCASGGYLVASACDVLVARTGSMVGSIGVIGSRGNFSGLADKLGVEYERFTAGEFKDAGTPLREMDEDEREYIQDLIDAHYDDFVGTVAAGRDLTEAEVRATEAKVYLGEDALEEGLVDAVGTEELVREALCDALDREAVRVREFTKRPSGLARLNIGAQQLSYSFGAGLADRLAGDGDGPLSIEYRRR
jgi:protease-4